MADVDETLNDFFLDLDSPRGFRLLKFLHDGFQRGYFFEMCPPESDELLVGHRIGENKMLEAVVMFQSLDTQNRDSVMSLRP